MSAGNTFRLNNEEREARRLIDGDGETVLGATNTSAGGELHITGTAFATARNLTVDAGGGATVMLTTDASRRLADNRLGPAVPFLKVRL